MKYFLCAVALMLCSCRDEDVPQGPTAEQSDQLNEIDDMLNRTQPAPDNNIADNVI